MRLRVARKVLSRTSRKPRGHTLMRANRRVSVGAALGFAYGRNMVLACERVVRAWLSLGLKL